MSSKVEKRIVVNVPVRTAYNQWTQFEDFPQFMGGVESVTQLSADRLKWVAHIAGVRRQWEATIVEQIPDRRIEWASAEGATNSGVVEFSDAGGNKTELSLTLEYRPEGMVEKVGDLLHVVARQAEHDLKKFKEFIEHEGHATGAWRDSVPTGEPSAHNRYTLPFDQTGGMVDLECESDGSAEGEIRSAAERKVRKPNDGGTIPPLGGNLGDR
ncbi:UNVERIFIED_ORG: putative membrane protein [Arthrobacter sp. UYCu721]